MNILMILAWRNIWRHPGRSGVLLAAIIAGLWAGVVVSAWGNGLMEQRTDYLIQNDLTHAQLHHPDYLTERDPWMNIPNHKDILAFLEEDERVRSYAPRTLSDGMLQSPVKSAGVRIHGVDAQREPETTTFHENLIEGSYLVGNIRNPVLIGLSLASEHNLEIGNRIVLSFQDVENQFTSVAFNIAGIYRTPSTSLDEQNVYVRSEDLTMLLAGRPVYHEIAMMLQGSEMADAVTADLNQEFSAILAQTWYEISPELRYLSDMGGFMVSIITGIIMLALAFSILNTMLMAIFERMRELGMLLAIGMSKPRVFNMIMLESIILTLTGAVSGLLLAFITIAVLGEHGIDLTMFGEGLAEFGYDPIVYPVMTTGQYAVVLLIVIVAVLLASIYPALKAMRLNPVEVNKE